MCSLSFFYNSNEDLRWLGLVVDIDFCELPSRSLLVFLSSASWVELAGKDFTVGQGQANG